MLIGVMDSSVMYLALWIAHSSFCSTRMAPIRRVMASSLGKMPTTLVRRLILPWSRSSWLVGVQLGPVLAGEAHVTVDSSPDGKRIRKDLLSYFIFRGAFARIPNVSSTAWRSKSRIERFS